MIYVQRTNRAQKSGSQLGLGLSLGWAQVGSLRSSSSEHLLLTKDPLLIPCLPGQEGVRVLKEHSSGFRSQFRPATHLF